MCTTHMQAYHESLPAHHKHRYAIPKQCLGYGYPCMCVCGEHSLCTVETHVAEQDEPAGSMHPPTSYLCTCQCCVATAEDTLTGGERTYPVVASWPSTEESTSSVCSL